MKRFKCQTPKIRTVTELIHSDEKLKKDYDIAEFDVKNLNSLISYNEGIIKMAIAKYMAMINTLDLSQPLLTIFKDRNASLDITKIIINSLGHVHKRVNPLVNNFEGALETVIFDDPMYSIVGEPIYFTENENRVMRCHVDRLSIVRMLECHYDTTLKVTSSPADVNKLKIMQAFTKTGQSKRRPSNDVSRYDLQLTETEVTRYVTLLLIVEHAYCHYSIFKTYDAYNYGRSLLDHSLIINKSRPGVGMNFSNLLLSKFNFNIEDFNLSHSSKPLDVINIRNN
ncbi:ODV-EC27 [Adoxophyes orana nucleopolyhedrovirus]|uniref:ODV-EC27 n=1 Tax=Adoxophyes orana nucleopolyhedrovirus TaxID=542343 RepID=UPI0001829BE6|nr:ODV-EC27 [Adoxophyes orana nucleopolyhedrovirus]ACF05313.1 ODV-EC27 [Adoxophyes orana nucleopolyhedrovirus]